MNQLTPEVTAFLLVLSGAVISFLVNALWWFLRRAMDPQPNIKAMDSLREKIDDIQREVHLLKVSQSADRQAWIDVKADLIEFKHQWREDISQLRTLISSTRT